MDKILRRVRMAEGQVARRNKRREVTRALAAKKDRIRAPFGKQAGDALQAARKARAEDWKLGPLAPRRDTGADAAHGTYWGTVSLQRARLTIDITPEERRARAAWCGGPKFLCLKVGDRVVVTEGTFKDKIGVINEIDPKYMTVELKDQLRTNVTVPEYLGEKDDKPVQVVNSRVPVSAVRLVHPLPHPQTGRVRDVMINELRATDIIYDRPTRELTFNRVVPGENVIIPWPVEVPEKFVDHPLDTLRIDVEERTFVPTLLRPPMPESIIDELRNKYSKFRTRHTPEYVAAKEAEEAAKKARKQSVLSMTTPIQEFNRHQRELRRARGQPELTPEMLAKIGEVIAKNRQRRKAGPAAAITEGGEKTEAAVAPVPETTTAEEQPRV